MTTSPSSMQDTSPSSSRDHRMQDTAEPAWEFNGLIEEGRITVESAELSSLGGNAHYKDNSRNQDTTRNHNDNINCSSKHHKLEERCNETSSLSSFEEDDDNGDADDDFIKEDEEEKEVAVPLAFPTTNTAAVTAAAAVSHPHQRERKQPQQSKTKSNPKSEEQSADDLLVYELNQLSFQERNTINEEVHGVFTGDNSYYPTETPELIQTALLELETELQLLPPKHKQAYELAQQLYPTTTFINTAKFRLIFLRCELFDPKLAAKRLVSYLDLCYEVVVESSSNNNNNSSNNNILERGILNVSDDFDEQDKQFLGSGDFQMLPKRDRSGRRITCNIASDIVINNEGGNVNPNAIISCRIKSALMIMMRLAMEEDILSIHRGCVGVFWTHNITHKNDTKTRSIVRSKMVTAIPIRYSSLHICFSVGGNASDNYTNFVSKFMHQTTNNAIQLGLKSMHILSIGKQHRPRLRMHTGSPMECLYALQSFGIPSVLMPIDRNSGRVTTKDHRKYIQHILNAEHIMKQEQQQKNLIENSTTIMTAAMTTTNNKKQKYHDHYQQPLVAEEKEQKILNKARKEHNNVETSVNMKKRHLEKQRDQKQRIPSQSKPPLASHIEYPEQNDILFGRGWDIQNRPGNLLFRRVLESYLNEYNNLESKKAKTTFACSITRELKELHQCRFLMKDPTQYGCWNEVTDKVARQKVSIGLRDIRKTRVKNNSRCTIGQAAATNITLPDHAQSGENRSNTSSSKRKYVDPILSDPIPIIGSTNITNDGNGRDFDMPWHELVEEIIGGEQDIILPGVYDRNDHSSNYCNNVNNGINNSNNVDNNNNNNNHNGGSYAFLNSRDQSRQFCESNEETKNNNGTDKQCFSWF